MKNVILFFNLQDRNATKKNIQKLITNNGATLAAPVEILNEEAKYFTEMFSFQSPPTPLNDAYCNVFFPKKHVKLSDTQKESCEGLITEDELLLAIRSFVFLMLP